MGRRGEEEERMDREERRRGREEERMRGREEEEWRIVEGMDAVTREMQGSGLKMVQWHSQLMLEGCNEGLENLWVPRIPRL